MTEKTHSQLTRAELMDAVWAEPLAQVAERVGMTANGLAKLCDRIDIPRPNRTYWNLSGKERKAARAALSEAPGDRSELVVFDGTPQQRRPRTRLSLDQRKAQLLDIAAQIVTAEGVAEVSLKRVAREAGITEAQAHNCFGKRIDLLVELARREIAEVERTRRDVIDRGNDYQTAVILSTVAYLDVAQSRGPMLQALLSVSEVREGLRAERELSRARSNEPVLTQMRRRYNFSTEEAQCANSAISAMILRAGGLLANRRINLAVANRLVLSMLMAGMISNAKSGAAEPA